MVPPPNTKLTEFSNATMWFDENGILCSVSKKVSQQTVEEAKQSMKDFLELTSGKKVCFLSDSTNSTPVSKEMRDYVAGIMPEIVKAVAVISRSAVGIMVANLFFSIKKQPYPVKLFDDEASAKEWLKHYL